MLRLWNSRAYRKGDEYKIYSLWKAVHKDNDICLDSWLKWWEWTYMKNPAGLGIIFVAEDRGEIVGHSSVIPMRMKIGSKYLTGFQSIETMTHPSYRKLGIYTKLARMTYDAAFYYGWDIGYRFPNRRSSYPIAKNRLNWFDVSNRISALLPVNHLNIIDSCFKNETLSRLFTPISITLHKFICKMNCRKNSENASIMLRRVTHFDEAINDLWKVVKNDYEIMLVKEKEFLNWRYIKHPLADYEAYVVDQNGVIDGYAVLGLREIHGLKAGIIYDLVAPLSKGDVISAMVKFAVNHFIEKGVDFVNYQLIGSNIYYRILRKYGFINLSIINKRLPFLAYLNSSQSITEAWLADRKNWFIQMGDSDAK